MWLYGEQLIGQGMPLEAAMILNDLMQQKRARSRFGATGGMLAAACWKAAGMQSRAEETIEWTKKSFPNASVTWANHQD